MDGSAGEYRLQLWFEQFRDIALMALALWPGRDMQRLRSVAFGLIAAGCGAFLTFAFSALQRMQAP